MSTNRSPAHSEKQEQGCRLASKKVSPRSEDCTSASLPYVLAQEAQRKALKPRKVRVSRTRPAEPRLSPTQQRGLAAETRAKHYLQARGVIVFAANLCSKTGEIDLICRDGATLVFVEVRQRRSRTFGGAAASVTPSKQKRLIRTAQHLLPGIVHQYLDGCPLPCRFDVIALEADNIQWIKHAFQLES